CRDPLHAQLRRSLPRVEVAALVAALALAGCGAGEGPKPVARSAQGPPNVVRVALTDFRWPVDPALARTRDDTTLARALYSTALRLDPASGAPVAGLCTGWSATNGFRTWTFTCHRAPAIAAALRRVQHLRAAPLRWLFADARVAAPTANRLVVRLPFPWRRFPYPLTTVGSAPRSVPGPFRLVTGSADQLVARNANLTLLFRRYTPRAAERAFERGDVDEAPVPTGEVAGARARLGNVVETR